MCILTRQKEGRCGDRLGGRKYTGTFENVGKESPMGDLSSGHIRGAEP
jgi:hypothetical protein